MSLFKANLPPSRVPTLTEVVEVQGALPDEVVPATLPTSGITSTTSALPAAAPVPVAALQPVNSELLTQQLMADIQKQVDAMLEVRLKEALAPIVTRLTDALARDARAELTKVMKDVVSRCVADEVRRSQSKR
jgi:hypothetical protein